jgi:predicted acylesterase/phospholipase RssA
VPDGEGHAPRWLSDSAVKPEGEKGDFDPKYDNWRRVAKAPVPIFNATTLNTGHNWQFTTTWMGEPPRNISPEVDRNDRLRPLFYWEAPPRYRRIRLGHAVAASTSTPGLLTPFPFYDLYPGLVVRLTDGGVYDNQGVGGLLEQGCTRLLVSDGSGQLVSQKDPNAGMLGVPLRSNTILVARVREAQYRELKAREDATLLRRLVFLHLKKEIEVKTIGWEGYKPAGGGEEPETSNRLLTSYGIRRDVQERLAAIRSDYDSFSDAEAFALMTSGYHMAGHELSRAGGDWAADDAQRAEWRFLAAEPLMDATTVSEDARRKFMRILDTAQDMSLKVFKLSPALRIAGLLTLGLFAIGASWLAWNFRDTVILKAPSVGLLALLCLLPLIAVFSRAFVRLAFFRDTAIRVLFALTVALIGVVVAHLYLYLFDPIYLRIGSSENMRGGAE